MIVVAFRIIFNTRVERLQNKFVVDGGDHDTTIHILVMPSKLIKSLSYYVAHFILIFLAVYLAPSEFEDISDTYKHIGYLIMLPTTSTESRASSSLFPSGL